MTISFFKIPEIDKEMDEWILLVTVTIGYDSMFQNWLYWFQKLSLNMKLFVVAEDPLFREKYENNTAFYLISRDNPFAPDAENEFGLFYDTPEFNNLTSRRPHYILNLLRSHSNVIYADIDAVWLKDPRPYLTGNYDFWAQLDGIMEAHEFSDGYLPYFCTGFLAIRNTTQSVNLLLEWIKELESSKVNEGESTLENNYYPY